jgi:hypothetical protein
MNRHQKHVLYTSLFIGTALAIASIAFINFGLYISQRKYNFDYQNNFSSYDKKPISTQTIDSQANLDAYVNSLSKDDILFELKHDLSINFNHQMYPWISNE